MSGLSPDLLAILACPACKGPLEPVNGGVRCRACAKTYPAVDGIVDFLS